MHWNEAKRRKHFNFNWRLVKFISSASFPRTKNLYYFDKNENHNRRKEKFICLLNVSYGRKFYILRRYCYKKNLNSAISQIIFLLITEYFVDLNRVWQNIMKLTVFQMSWIIINEAKIRFFISNCRSNEWSNGHHCLS